METAEFIVVGAGVVGLSTARALVKKGREVYLCEREIASGTGVTARNSGVIHAGLYYPADSLKGRFCLRGKQMLYELCRTQGVPHLQTGKLIVATSPEEIALLGNIRTTAAKGGVNDLVPLTKQEAEQMEPALNVEAALFSPSTGIVDVPALVTALEASFEQAGGNIAFGCEVISVRRREGGFIVRLADKDGRNEAEIFTKSFVNAAGLGAQKLAHTIEGLSEKYIPAQRMVRGHYFGLSGRSPFSRLVYPVPVKGGLGVHATLDTAGILRFGPDVESVDRESYQPNETRRKNFITAIERYYPDIKDRVLTPDFVGIRPQVGAFGAFNDFIVQGEESHGIRGLVNMFGIESPGLTSALAIAEHVASRLFDPPV